jgi:hypothetical protein
MTHPVRVVFTQHFTDNRGTFVETAVVDQSLPQHGVEDTPLHRLEPVAGIRQGPADNDRHRVVDVGSFHDIGDVGLDDFFVFSIHCAGSRG